MSVLIKGMEMPTSCYECSLQDDECFGSIKCQYVKTWGSARMRAVDCPLVEVPPHGRLIDADALSMAVLNCGYYDNADEDVVWELVQDAPTVIEADELIET